MPLSDNKTPQIITLPIVSPDNDFTYVFDLDLPSVPLDIGGSSLQILWLQFTYSSTATVGTRIPVFDLFDENAVTQYAVASINTTAAGLNQIHNFLQGVIVFPVSVQGLIRTFPVDGLYAFNDWSFRIHDAAGIDPADSMVGNMQLRMY